MFSNFNSECSSEYTLYSTKCGEFCYRFDNKNCISWTAARTTCQGEGGELLEPDVCTYPFFHGLVRENRGTCADTWIGGFRDLPMLNYTTVRGNPLPDNFQWWGSNQPSKRNTQACVEMTPGRGFLMNDDECADLNGYICQKYFKH
ncbi:hypothetical protein ACJMK2_039487 [Sinanodonta woodiana]|uniref:C-type lectin domain-containing protein n=1 Tax=Sinanodonta woodiana TaxID=1069815 RepID=A0ABD3WFF3_SINWO